jgi:RNase adapter protein RapZ
VSTHGGQELSKAEISAPRARVILLTGMSGAGRSTALKIREDFADASVADLPALIANPAADGPAITVGADTRTRGSSAQTPLDTLAKSGSRSEGGRYIDCNDDQRERRYIEPRRSHPLAGVRPIVDGIRRERQMPSAMRNRADLLVDNTASTAAELTRLLVGHFSCEAIVLRVFVTSFADRQGLRREADLLFDGRLVENPHYIGTLRRLTGFDPAGAARVETTAEFVCFCEGLCRLLALLSPSCEASGTTYLTTTAIGCTGGSWRRMVTRHIA